MGELIRSYSLCFRYVPDELADGIDHVWCSFCSLSSCYLSETRSVVLFTISRAAVVLTFTELFFSDVNWGSSTQAQTYKEALKSIQELVRVEEHVKNYRPQILVLSGLPSARPPLVDFGYLICKHLSLMVCGHVIKTQTNQRTREAYTRRMYQWLRDHKIKAFYSLVDNIGFKGAGRSHLRIDLFKTNYLFNFFISEGASSLMQLSGIGKMKPNMLLMGYKRDWSDCPQEDLDDYFGVIQYEYNFNV